MFPVRCYTCNAVLAHLSPAYERHTTAGGTAKDALQNVPRMCCRRMFLGYVDLSDDFLTQPNVDSILDQEGTLLKRCVRHTRVVSCD